VHLRQMKCIVRIGIVAGTLLAVGCLVVASLDTVGEALRVLSQLSRDNETKKVILLGALIAAWFFGCHKILNLRGSLKWLCIPLILLAAVMLLRSRICELLCNINDLTVAKMLFEESRTSPNHKGVLLRLFDSNYRTMLFFVAIIVGVLTGSVIVVAWDFVWGRRKRVPRDTQTVVSDDSASCSAHREDPDSARASDVPHESSVDSVEPKSLSAQARPASGEPE